VHGFAVHAVPVEHAEQVLRHVRFKHHGVLAGLDGARVLAARGGFDGLPAKLFHRDGLRLPGGGLGPAGRVWAHHHRLEIRQGGQAVGEQSEGIGYRHGFLPRGKSTRSSQAALVRQTAHRADLPGALLGRITRGDFVKAGGRLDRDGFGGAGLVGVLGAGFGAGARQLDDSLQSGIICAVGGRHAGAQPAIDLHHQVEIALGDVLVDVVVGEACQGALFGDQQHLRRVIVAKPQDLLAELAGVFF